MITKTVQKLSNFIKTLISLRREEKQGHTIHKTAPEEQRNKHLNSRFFVVLRQ